MNSRMIAIFGLVVALFSLAACSTNETPAPDNAKGIIKGSVVIGPLCPVEPCSEPFNVYESRALLLEANGLESI